ncbi:ABC transporter permease, partial [Planctomycetota bacterium]
MTAYIIRRVLYAIPILIGVNIITFMLFFSISSPEQMARQRLGGTSAKKVDTDAVKDWLQKNGYNRKKFVDWQKPGLQKVTDTIFFQKSVKMMAFKFGRSEHDQADINHQIAQRMGPSLSIAIPTFI